MEQYPKNQKSSESQQAKELSSGELIREARLKLNLTQAELGSAINTNQATISLYERDKMRFDEEIAEKLVKVLNLSKEKLLASQTFVKKSRKRVREALTRDPIWTEDPLWVLRRALAKGVHKKDKEEFLNVLGKYMMVLWGVSTDQNNEGITAFRGEMAAFNFVYRLGEQIDELLKMHKEMRAEERRILKNRLGDWQRLPKREYRKARGQMAKLMEGQHAKAKAYDEFFRGFWEEFVNFAMRKQKFHEADYWNNRYLEEVEKCGVVTMSIDYSKCGPKYSDQAERQKASLEANRGLIDQKG